MRKRKVVSLNEVVQGKQLLTIEEAAQVLSLGRTLFYGLLSRKEIYTIKIGRAHRVPVTALQAYIQHQIEQQHQGGKHD